MRVLIVGGGGREHALAWKVAQSPRLGEMFLAPGNAGTAALGTNLPLPADDVDGIVAFATPGAIDLVIIGPEGPLAAGLTDALQAAGQRVFGPTQAAALSHQVAGEAHDVHALTRRLQALQASLT